MKKLLSVAVVVLTFNSVTKLGNALFECIDELLSNGVYLIVVDNGSSDGTPRILASRYRDFLERGSMRIVALRRNTGWSGGNLVGYLLARKLGCRFIGYLNDDILVSMKHIESLIETLQNRADICAIQPVIVYPTGRVQTAGFTIDSLFHNYPLCFIPSKTVPVPQLSGACFFVDYSKLRESVSILLFDRALFLYQDDLDLSLKIWVSGCACAVHPKAVAIHRTKIGKLNPVMYYYIVRNTLYLYFKYYPLYSAIPRALCYTLLRLYEASKLVKLRRDRGFVYSLLKALIDLLRRMLRQAFMRRSLYRAVLGPDYHRKVLRLCSVSSRLRRIKSVE